MSASLLNPDSVEPPFRDRNRTDCAPPQICSSAVHSIPIFSPAASLQQVTELPLFRYLLHVSACLPKTTLSINIVSCFISSACLYLWFTASRKTATGVPWGVYRNSGSFVRLPINMILLYIYPSLFCSAAGSEEGSIFSRF